MKNKLCRWVSDPIYDFMAYHTPTRVVARLLTVKVLQLAVMLTVRDWTHERVAKRNPDVKMLCRVSMDTGIKELQKAIKEAA